MRTEKLAVLGNGVMKGVLAISAAVNYCITCWLLACCFGLTALAQQAVLKTKLAAQCDVLKLL
jgi:hypothetical protein